MLNIIKNNQALTLVGFIVALAIMALPAAAFAQAQIGPNLDCGTTLQLNASNCDISGGVLKLNQTITNLINAFSVVVGLVAVVMLIYGGFRYVTSGGDSGNVGNAKNTILYAIVGLIIVALAQAIVQFVLTKA